MSNVLVPVDGGSAEHAYITSLDFNLGCRGSRHLEAGEGGGKGTLAWVGVGWEGCRWWLSILTRVMMSEARVVRNYVFGILKEEKSRTCILIESACNCILNTPLHFIAT